MMCDYKEILKRGIEEQTDQLIEEWVNLFDPGEKDDEYRYYDDFLGFFEECLERDLDPHSEEAESLKIFLQKLIELKGEENFFNFKDSVYTCYLKFPLLKYLWQNNCFDFDTIRKLTSFFESLTSKIMVEWIEKNNRIKEESFAELEEREAPIAQILQDTIMVSIVGTLDSNRVIKIIDKILERLEKSDIAHVIVDIGAIYDMNSEVARQIVKLNNAIHFMGARAYLTGITPAIAKNLTHLDIKLGDIKTFSTTYKAVSEIIDGTE